MSNKIQSINLDDATTIFFARELEYIKARSYDVEYPALKATQLIPVSSEADPGAEVITYQQYDKVGMAKIISNYADDLPASDVKGKEFTARVRPIGSSFSYNIQEIRNAQMAGKPLEQRKANAARRSVEQKINKIAWFGEEEYGLQGFVDNPNVTRVKVADNDDSTSTKFEDKTPDEILKDMNDLANNIVDLTNGVEMPNTLLLPIKQYTHIASTARSKNSDTTILEYFLMNNPFIDTVEWVNELKGAGVGIDGVIAAGEDVMIAYDRNPDKLTLEIPQDYEQFAPQERNLAFVVNAHARTAGVIIYYPLSVAIAEGI